MINELIGKLSGLKNDEYRRRIRENPPSLLCLSLLSTYDFILILLIISLRQVELIRGLDIHFSSIRCHRHLSLPGENGHVNGANITIKKYMGLEEADHYI